MPRWSATSWASRMRPPRVERHPLGGDLLHGAASPLSTAGSRSPECSVERSGRGALGDQDPAGEVGVRPDDAPGPISASGPTVCSMVAPAPTTQSTSRVSGPISQPSPTTVGPCSIVPGNSVTSRPRFTVTSMNVWRGSSIVTPLSSHRRLVRARSSRSASASCQRSLTPWVSSAGACTQPIRWPIPASTADHVGQVVLALGVVGGELAQRRPEQVAAERVDARADLADACSSGVRVALLDDPLSTRPSLPG